MSPVALDVILDAHAARGASLPTALAHAVLLDVLEQANPSAAGRSGGPFSVGADGQVRSERPPSLLDLLGLCERLAGPEGWPPSAQPLAGWLGDIESGTVPADPDRLRWAFSLFLPPPAPVEELAALAALVEAESEDLPMPDPVEDAAEGGSELPTLAPSVELTFEPPVPMPVLRDPPEELLPSADESDPPAAPPARPRDEAPAAPSRPTSGRFAARGGEFASEARSEATPTNDRSRPTPPHREPDEFDPPAAPPPRSSFVRDAPRPGERSMVEAARDIAAGVAREGQPRRVVRHQIPRNDSPVVLRKAPAARQSAQGTDSIIGPGEDRSWVLWGLVVGGLAAALYFLFFT